jgi:putative Holliday junction resolvase
MPEAAAAGNWLAIDYGEQTIGLAVGHLLTGSARPLAPVRNQVRDQLKGSIEGVLKDWRPTRIIVGLPLSGAGEETPMSGKARKFASWLSEIAPQARICLHDERLSSEAAASEFALRRNQGRARQRDAAHLDSMAAALILESWMSEHGAS